MSLGEGPELVVEGGQVEVLHRPTPATGLLVDRTDGVFWGVRLGEFVRSLDQVFQARFIVPTVAEVVDVVPVRRHRDLAGSR